MTTSPVVPYQDKSDTKKKQVSQMFDNISTEYDFLNHFLSLGIDVYWRNVVVSKLKAYRPNMILDMATGTADLALAMYKLKPHKIVGVDISNGMLEVGRKKVNTQKKSEIIELVYGDSEEIPFEAETFDAAVCAFGVRNFENLALGLQGMKKVLKKGSPIFILEFSKPTVFPIKQLFSLYFKAILPWFGRLFSKDKSAYSYLPASVQAFPERTDFLKILSANGFTQCTYQTLTFGICCLYTGIRE